MALKRRENGSVLEESAEIKDIEKEPYFNL